MHRILFTLLVLSTLWFNTFSFGQTKATHLSVSVKLPDTVNVCLDTAKYLITIVNDSSITADSVLVSYAMKDGFAFTGIFNGAKMVFDSVPNVPVFYIDSIASGDTVFISFSTTIGCKIKTSVKIADVIKANCFYGTNPFQISDSTNSYNVTSASIILIKNNGNLYENIGLRHNRSITVFNMGFGAVDTVVLKIAVEPELKTLKFLIYTVSIPYDTTGGIVTIILTDSLIVLGTPSHNNSLLEYNEGIKIEESYTVTSCSPDTTTAYQTQYTASWGCGGQACESVTTYADVKVITGFPSVRCENSANPQETSFGSSVQGTTVFTYKNKGSDATDDKHLLPPGNGMATNIQFNVSHHKTAVDITRIRINGKSIDSITGIKIDTVDTTITITLDKVTDSSLGIADADGDGSFDELLL